MAYRIISDSCLDYPDVPMSWVKRVALTIRLGDQTYTDDERLNTSELVSRMKEEPEAPQSACPSPGDFLEAYGQDDADVYVVVISDKLSGSYSSAMLAADMLRDKQPERKIHVFNSFSASAGQVTICLKLYELLSSGLSFEVVVEQVKEYIASMTTMFMLDDLSVLRKNGRLSHLQALVTNALRIRLVCGATPEGTIAMRAKALTAERALLSMVNLVKEKCKSIVPSERYFVITQCESMKRAEKVRDAVMEACGFKEVLVCRPSGISAMYANEGGIVVGF